MWWVLMAVHEKIKFIRQLKGWSQEDMAEKLAMSVNGYGAIERGETNVNISRLEQISQIFGIELSQLVALNDKNNFYMSGASSTGQLNQDNCVSNYYGADEQTQYTQHELEKLKLTIQFKDKELELKDQEIANLQKIITLLEGKVSS